MFRWNEICTMVEAKLNEIMMIMAVASELQSKWIIFKQCETSARHYNSLYRNTFGASAVINAFSAFCHKIHIMRIVNEMVTLNKILSLTHMRTEWKKKPCDCATECIMVIFKELDFHWLWFTWLILLLHFNHNFIWCRHSVQHRITSLNGTLTHTLPLLLFFSHVHAFKTLNMKKNCVVKEKKTERIKSRKKKFHGEFTPMRSMSTSQLWY